MQLLNFFNSFDILRFLVRYSAVRYFHYPVQFLAGSVEPIRVHPRSGGFKTTNLHPVKMTRQILHYLRFTRLSDLV